MSTPPQFHLGSRQDFTWVGWLQLGFSIIAAGIAVFALWTWWVGDWSMAAYGDTVPMAPSTALLLIMLSVTLGLHQRWAAKPLARILEITVAIVTVATALTVIVSAFAGLMPEWEHWFAHTEATARGFPVGHMSPFTAGTLALAACSLLMLHPRYAVRKWHSRLGLAANLLGGSFSLVTALAYASGTPLFYDGGTVPIAFPSALSLTALNLALLLTGKAGLALGEWWIHRKDSTVPQLEHAFRRRVFLIAAVFSGGLVLTGFFILRNWQDTTRFTARGQLEAIANLKAEQIRQWREERLGEARFLLRTPAVAADIAALLLHPGEPASRAKVTGWLEPIKGGARYETVALYDANSALLLTIPESTGRDLQVSREEFATVLARHEIVFGDLRRDRDTIHLDLLVPIFAPPGEPEAASQPPRSAAPLGVVLLRLNPENYLFPLLQRLPAISATAETILVRREGDEVVYLNELRHQRGTALTLRRPIQERSLFAAKAARGELGVSESLDYRGVAVLATARAIPDSSWLLLTKVDLAEIYAPMQREAWRTGVLIVVLLAVAILAALAMWRQRHSAFLNQSLVMEREHHALAQRLDLVMQYANDIILLMDGDGRILEANARALATYGYTLDELRRLPPGGLSAPAAAGDLARQLELFDLPEGGVFETVHQCKDGTTFPVETNGRSVLIQNRRFKFGIYRDITQRKDHERQIERLNRHYAALSRINQAIVHTESREMLLAEICRVLVEFGRFKMAWICWREPGNGAVVPAAQFGDDQGYLAGIKIYTDGRREGCGPTGTAIREDRTYVCNDFSQDPHTAPWREKAARSGFQASISLPVHLAGQVAGALNIYAAETNAFGQKEVALLEEAAEDVTFALGNLERETQRQQAEAALRSEQHLFASLAGTIPDHIYFKDRQSRLVRINDSMARGFGMSSAEAVGKTDFDLFTEEHARQAYEDEQRVMSSGEPIINLEEKETWPDGRITWVSTTKMPLRDAAGNVTGLVGISREITERKDSERRIREQAELLDKAAEAIVVVDLDQRVTFWSHGAERLFGYTSAEMLGRTVEEVFSLGAGGGAALIREGLTTTSQWRGEVQGFDRQSRPLIIETSITLIRDDAGRPTSRLSISADITAKTKLQEQFMRAQRLESIGMLSAGIAHDLNNVLAPILMAASMLRSHTTDERDLLLLDTVEKSAGRGAGLVRQILGFAHGIGGEARVMQAKHLLRDIVDVIEATFPKSIALEHQIPSDLWPILANPTQIHQVLLNLCVNARDAMPGGGTLRLHAENCVLDEPAASRLEGARPGSWLVLHVEDTGSGIPPEMLPKIWDPFFTTKTADKGTGLGLATVRGIVATHHGFITLETALGRGTTIRVYLPADESAIVRAASAKPFAPIRGQNELILVVDDEQSIRQVAKSILTKFGYRVLTAEDGLEGVSLFEANAAEISLVITDFDMPNLGGAGLAERIRQISPAIKLLAISGAGREGGSNEQSGPFAGAKLMKPFSAETLLDMVHRVLHPADPPA